MNLPHLRAASGKPRGCRQFVAVLAVASLLAAGTATADAAGPKPLGGPRALAVSVPPDPVPIQAGTSGQTLARVINPNRAPVSVTIASRALSLGNNGKVTVRREPDQRWQKHVHFPTRPLTIPAQGYLDIPLGIQVPRRIEPDLYFIGFLVTPIASSTGSVQVINQIGSFITIDVPGPRLRKLEAAFDLPSFVLASDVQGTLRITNVGRAAVRFWGENDTTSSPGGGLRQQRLDPSLLPRGTSRFISVSGKPAWPVGFVTMTVHVIYPGRTDATTKELIFSKRVIVIHPLVPIGLGSLFLFGGLLWWARRRRRRQLVALTSDQIATDRTEAVLRAQRPEPRSAHRQDALTTESAGAHGHTEPTVGRRVLGANVLVPGSLAILLVSGKGVLWLARHHRR